MVRDAAGGNNMTKKNINMIEGALLLQIIRYAIPVIFTNVLQLMFNVADLAIVGEFCGSDSVAAIGATTSISQLIILFFTGFQLRIL